MQRAGKRHSQPKQRGSQASADKAHPPHPPLRPGIDRRGQHQGTDACGAERGQQQRHPSAPGGSHHVHPLQPLPLQPGKQAEGLGLHAAIAVSRGIALAKAGQIDRIGGKSPGEDGQVQPPAEGAAQQAMQQHHRRPGACLHIMEVRLSAALVFSISHPLLIRRVDSYLSGMVRANPR